MEENKDFHIIICYIFIESLFFVCSRQFLQRKFFAQIFLLLNKVKKIDENVNSVAFISRSKIVNSYISFDILSISENVHFTY